jgi:hypothetical protein
MQSQHPFRDTDTHVPNSFPSLPSTGPSSLTSSLASHTRLTYGRIRLTDIEEGLPNNGGVVPAAGVAEAEGVGAEVRVPGSH